MVSILVLLLLNIFLGFFLCFYGGKIVTWLTSLVIILVTGAYIYSKYGYSSRNLVVFLVFAVIILMAFNFFVKFGLFLIGGVIGVIFGFVLMNFLPRDYSKYYNLFILVIALVFGLIAALSKKKVLAFLTSLAGANIMSPSLIYLILNIKNEHVLTRKLSYIEVGDVVNSFTNSTPSYDRIVLGIIVIFTLIGFLFQIRKKRKIR